MNLWNERNLKPPPTATIKSIDKNISLLKLLTSCGTLQINLSNQKYLHAEAAILSRCIYRMKTKLRNDKGMKSMQKVNTALKRYLEMNYIKDLDNFLSIIPRKYEKALYMPTLNMVDYILVRTQGFAKLMCRIGECARECAYYMETKIFIGQFWKIALIGFAIVSRIFVLTRQLAKASCAFHNELNELRKKFRNTSEFLWLPEGYIHPNKLDDWLDVDWLNADLTSFNIPVDNKNFLRFFEDDSDIEITGEFTDVNDDLEIINEYINIPDGIGEVKEEMENIKKKTKEALEKNQISNERIENELKYELVVKQKDDIGEVVQRKKEDKVSKYQQLKLEEDKMKKTKIKAEKVLKKNNMMQKTKKEEKDKSLTIENIKKRKIKDGDSKGKKKIDDSTRPIKKIRLKELQTAESEIKNKNQDSKRKKELHKYRKQENEILVHIRENEKKVNGIAKKLLDVNKKLILKEKDEEEEEVIKGNIEGSNTTRKKNVRKIAKKQNNSELSIRTKGNKINKNNKIENGTKKDGVKKQKKSSELLLDKITTIDNLKVFIKRENGVRERNTEKCALKSINKMQWNMLRNSLNNLVNKAKSADSSVSAELLSKAKEVIKLNLSE